MPSSLSELLEHARGVKVFLENARNMAQASEVFIMRGHEEARELWHNMPGDSSGTGYRIISELSEAMSQYSQYRRSLDPPIQHVDDFIRKLESIL